MIPSTVKYGGIALLFAWWSWFAYHQGGLASRAAAEAQHAAQLQAVAKVYENQVLAREASEAKLQKVENDYDALKSIPDPASVGVAHRLLIAAASGPAGCDVSTPSAVAGGVPGPTPITIGPSAIERALDDYIQACGEDAKLLRTVQALAPPPQ